MPSVTTPERGFIGFVMDEILLSLDLNA